MNKKGFTLVELLAVIVIVGVLLYTAIINIGRLITKNQKNAYDNHEKRMVSAARNYLTTHTEIEIPESGYTLTVNDLQSAGLLDEIVDPKSKKLCDKDSSKVIIKKGSTSEYNTEYTFEVCLYCPGITDPKCKNINGD